MNIVWIAIFLSIIIFSAFFRFIINKQERQNYRSASVIMLTFGAFCQQTVCYPISKNSLHSFIFILLIFCLMIHKYYTSMLFSIIVNPNYVTDIQNKEDLSNSDLPIGFLNTTSIRNFIKVKSSIHLIFLSINYFFFSFHSFQSTNQPDFLKFFQKKMYNTNKSMETFFMDSITGFSKVKQKHFAFHSEESVANTVIPQLFDEHEICDLKRVIFRPTLSNGIVLKKNSPFRERMSINWLWMREIGLAHHKIKHWEGTRLQCISKKHFESVGFNYVLSIFLMLLISFPLSISILLWEIFYHKRSTFARE